MNINQRTLSEAYHQLSDFIAVHQTSLRSAIALEKAFEVAQTNDTIKFDGEVLSFVSLDSNRQRTVTEAGCHASCDCAGKESYHAQLFNLLSKYCEMESAPKPSLSLAHVPFLKTATHKTAERVGG